MTSVRQFTRSELASPFFRTLPLEQFGLEWIHPPAPLAHPMDDGTVAMLERSIEETAAGLGSDAASYRRLMEPLAEDWETIIDAFFGPLRILPLARHPFKLANFGLKAIRSARGLAEHLFREARARAMFAGSSAHWMLPLEQPPSAAPGLVLGLLGHVVGWPIPKGGSQHIANATGGLPARVGR